MLINSRFKRRRFGVPNRGPGSSIGVGVLLLTMVLVASSAQARQWCFGAADYDKKTKVCRGGGWVVVKGEPSDDRIDCYLRTGSKNPGLYVTDRSVLFINQGTPVQADSKNGIRVDKNEPVLPDLVANGEGIEFANSEKRASLVEQFKAGITARLRAEPNTYRYSLIGFTKAYEKFTPLCLTPSDNQ